MPPRASATRKKSRPEVVQDELYRALLERSAAQPSASQPSAGQPSDAQPPPSTLPLVLPSPTIHSGFDSTTTGACLSVRSIRSRNAVAEATVSGTQASSSNKKRGVVTGKRTATIVHTTGKSCVTYDPAVSGPLSQVRSRLVSDMSAFIKDRAPMLYPTFGDMPLSERSTLFDFLSESYDIDPADKALITWIQKKAADRFKNWKYKIHKNWQVLGDAPIPQEFTHRPDLWEWLCNYFKAQTFQELGTAMAQIRASENKKAHSGGTKSFVVRAHELTLKGDQAPHLTAYVEAYRKFDADHVAAVQSARTAKVAKFMADLPPIDEASDGTSPASALAPPLVVSYETHVSVLETSVGPSRGMRVRGLGNITAKLPHKRCPSSQTDSGRSTELEAEVARLMAHQAAIVEQLQRKRAEREREKERERAEREIERVDFEHRMQAQIANMLREVGYQPQNPPLGGSFSHPP